MSQSLQMHVTGQTGIRATSLAKMLGVHGSVFTHMNQGARNLPDKALPRLVELYGLLSQLPPTSDPVPNEEEITEVRKEAEWLSALLLHLQRQLQSIREQYTQAATLQQLMQAYEALHPPQNEKQRRWIGRSILCRPKKDETKRLEKATTIVAGDPGDANEKLMRFGKASM